MNRYLEPVNIKFINILEVVKVFYLLKRFSLTRQFSSVSRNIFLSILSRQVVIYSSVFYQDRSESLVLQ